MFSHLQKRMDRRASAMLGYRPKGTAWLSASGQSDKAGIVIIVNLFVQQFEADRSLTGRAELANCNYADPMAIWMYTWPTATLVTGLPQLTGRVFLRMFYHSVLHFRSYAITCDGALLALLHTTRRPLLCLLVTGIGQRRMRTVSTNVRASTLVGTAAVKRTTFAVLCCRLRICSKSGSPCTLMPMLTHTHVETEFMRTILLRTTWIVRLAL